MRILIYDINYAPELTGIGKYTGEMGAWLAGQGHEVEVFTAMPYYPEWQVHPAYKGKGWFTETIAGATVRRSPFYVPKRVTALKRILHEVSFQLSSLPYWLRAMVGPKYDVVVTVAPPFQAGLVPVLYSRLRNVPVWLHIQDLQIDMAKELKMIRSERFLNLLFVVEKYILKRATVVSTISDGMVRKVDAKNVLATDCVAFPNWVDEATIRPLPREQSLRTEFGLAPTNKVILYSGSLGEKQGLELVIDAAAHFQPQPDVKFVIVGSGSGRTWLEGLARDRQLTNIQFHPLQPYEKLSALLATPDLHLVLQKKSASDLVLPSKLSGILAAGGCALVSAMPGTTLHDVIETHQMGLLIEPESTPALIAGIEQALAMDLDTYRQNARQYARQHLGKEAILRRFERQLYQLANVPSPSPAELAQVR